MNFNQLLHLKKKIHLVSTKSCNTVCFSVFCLALTVIAAQRCLVRSGHNQVSAYLKELCCQYLPDCQCPPISARQAMFS